MSGRSRDARGPYLPPHIKGSFNDDMGPPPLRYKVSMDPFVKAPNVVALDPNNFMEYLSAKDAALVFFYTPGDRDNEWLRKEIIQAASTTKRPNHAYAAVNCGQNKELCMANKVTQTPRLSMYSRGYYVGSMRDVTGLKAQVIKQYVELSPLLTQPKGTMD